MAVTYDQQHKLITFHGILWKNAAQQEQWSIGMRIALSDPTDLTVTQAMVNSADSAFRTRWSAGTVAFDSNHQYLYAKLAPIGTNGHYPSGMQSYESAHTALSGTASSSLAPWPGQCGVAVTLVSVKAGGRGKGSKGRVYLPPLGTTIDSNGRITDSTATGCATFVKNVIADLNGITGLGTVAVFGAESTVNGATVPAEHHVVGWTRCGTVVDTIRRRRRQLTENYRPDVAVA